jgi:hypothetical protein
VKPEEQSDSKPEEQCELLRARIYRIQRKDLIALLNWRQFEYVTLPLVTNIPEGARITGVHHEFSEDAFLVRVEHEEFEPVPEGQRIPRASEPLTLQMQCFEVASLQPVT